MTRGPRLWAGIVLAAVIAVATPVVAEARWGSSGQATLALQAAPFGVTATADPPGAAATLNANGTATAIGYVGVDVRRLTAPGAVGWTTGDVTVTASASGGSGATIRYAQAVGSTPGTCSALTSWSADAAQPSTATSVPSPSSGAGTLVCVRVTATGLTSVDNGRTVTVSFAPSVANGGWTASATTVTTSLAITGAPAPVVPNAVCEPTTNGWYLGYAEAVDFLLPGGAAYEPVWYDVYVDSVDGILVKSFDGAALPGDNDGRPTLGAEDLRDRGIVGAHPFFVVREGGVTVATFTATVSGDPSYPDVTCGAPQPVAQAACAHLGPMIVKISYAGAPVGSYTLRIDPATGALNSPYGTLSAAELAGGWYVSPANVTIKSGRGTVTFQILNTSGAVVAAVDATFNGSALRCVS